MNAAHVHLKQLMILDLSPTTDQRLFACRITAITVPYTAVVSLSSYAVGVLPIAVLLPVQMLLVRLLPVGVCPIDGLRLARASAPSNFGGLFS